MTAKPGLPPAWPRRRRVAGYARGSASAGTVPIPVRMGRRAELHRDLVQRLRTLPGVGVTVADDGDSTTFTFASHDAEAGPGGNSRPTAFWLADVTRASEIRVRLPATTNEALRQLGWVVATTGETTRVRGPRTVGESDVAWRILLCAYEFAASQPGEASRPARAEPPGCLASPPFMTVETAAAI